MFLYIDGPTNMRKPDYTMIRHTQKSRCLYFAYRYLTLHQCACSLLKHLYNSFALFSVCLKWNDVFFKLLIKLKLHLIPMPQYKLILTQGVYLVNCKNMASNPKQQCFLPYRW